MSRRRRRAVLDDPLYPRFERRGRKAASKEDLTDELVASFVPGTREYAVHDYGQPGLFVRVRTTGSKTYYYRPKGRKKALSLGSAEHLNVAEARLKAQLITLHVRGGGSINAMSAKSNEGTVRQAFEAYLKLSEYSSDWWVRVHREFTRVILPAIGDTKLAELTPEHVEGVIAQRTTYYGRRNLRVIISAFLSRCVFTGRIKYNFLKGGLAISRPEPRERMRLDWNALRYVWEACDELPPVWRDAFRLVIASGLSIREVLQLPSNAGLTWSMEDHHFGPLATELLATIPRPAGPYLFAAPGKWSPMTFQQGMLKRLQKAADIGSFTAGDLSRASNRIAPVMSRRGLEWDDLLPPRMPEPDPWEEVDL